MNKAIIIMALFTGIILADNVEYKTIFRGEQKQVTPYVNGKIDGIQKEYDEKGNVVRETKYVNEVEQ
jgi:antitoxin component YwqK of YwqJK toxin-antitoxin module